MHSRSRTSQPLTCMFWDPWSTSDPLLLPLSQRLLGCWNTMKPSFERYLIRMVLEWLQLRKFCRGTTLTNEHIVRLLKSEGMSIGCCAILWEQMIKCFCECICHCQKVSTVLWLMALHSVTDEDAFRHLKYVKSTINDDVHTTVLFSVRFQLANWGNRSIFQYQPQLFSSQSGHSFWGTVTECRALVVSGIGDS